MIQLKSLSQIFIALVLIVSLMCPIAFANPSFYYTPVVVHDIMDPDARKLNADLVQVIDVYNFSNKTFQDVYIFIDVSDSASAWGANSETLISNFKTSAVNIIDNDYFNKTNITYFTIGEPSRSDAGNFYFVGKSRESNALKTEILNLKTGDGLTDIIRTVNDAVLVMENRSSESLIIILSDGNLVNNVTYNELLHTMNQADKYGATILFMNIYTNGSMRPNQFNNSRGSIYAESLMKNYKGDGIYVESMYGLPIDFIFHFNDNEEVLYENIIAPVSDTNPENDGFENPEIKNSEPESSIFLSEMLKNNLIYIFMATVVLIMLFILYELHLLRKRREN